MWLEHYHVECRGFYPISSVISISWYYYANIGSRIIHLVPRFFRLIYLMVVHNVKCKDCCSVIYLFIYFLKEVMISIPSSFRCSIQSICYILLKWKVFATDLSPTITNYLTSPFLSFTLKPVLLLCNVYESEWFHSLFSSSMYKVLQKRNGSAIDFRIL